ncbi:MAG TPA: hypothetical protein VHJ34_11585 [Actinomycetota bacterium]|nr:hypothetical protein [Actinomycetota bacterium]
MTARHGIGRRAARASAAAALALALGACGGDDGADVRDLGGCASGSGSGIHAASGTHASPTGEASGTEASPAASGSATGASGSASGSGTKC